MRKIKDFGALSKRLTRQVMQVVAAGSHNPAGRAGARGVRGERRPHATRFAGQQRQGHQAMRKSIPALMFASSEQSRLTTLRNWVLENAVTEISMNERQFWNLAGLQPVAEKPWTTFMGRPIFVSDMPVDAQKCLGVFDTRNSAPTEPALAAAS
jgi:hypothetical protein